MKENPSAEVGRWVGGGLVVLVVGGWGVKSGTEPERGGN